MGEIEQVAGVLKQLGAEDDQAKVMAAQLIKRAEQISEERGVEKVSALAELLQLVKSGRDGETHERSN
ncbi:hypothetical protein [Pelagicoccus sp. SDUM812002]|uniref:hypothetical protein n=1 Tax=Pelagicoccus sp. SDUM812002 TaxID=3041266 RepID=UPI002810550C|nr:hypothetical protein [Pelagicoccus sp. SDUM812002]MDQ8188148.1 hypothetical protein [Pelagicoccus sp. SDUM812002]